MSMKGYKEAWQEGMYGANITGSGSMYARRFSQEHKDAIDMAHSPRNKFDEDLCFVDVCFDFDGVICIHHETTPCIVVAGEPVVGVIETMQTYGETLTLAIHSVRSKFQQGREAMRGFIAEHSSPAFADAIQYPEHKPKATYYIDDRGIRYEGEPLPDTTSLEQYAVPWHKKISRG